MILLSILIPTVVGREESYWRLVGEFTRQMLGIEQGLVEILQCKDDKQIPIGVKREMLYDKANGEYSVQWDDDDFVMRDGLYRIIHALETKPDCVTYKEFCMMDGVYKSSNHSLKYEKWQDNFDGYDYTRSPFYKDVIKTEIARSVPFEPIRYNEDERWSMALRPHLKNEVHIDNEVYYYQYTSTPHNERYGFDRD